MDSPETSQQPATLRHYIGVLLRRKWIIAATVIITVATTFALSSAQKPTYQAVAEILVQPTMSDSLFQQQLTQRQVSHAVETEIRVLKSGPVRARVRETLGVIPPVKARAIPDTEIFQVVTTHTSKRDAIAISSAYVNAYLTLRREQVVEELLAASAEISEKVESLQTQIDELSGSLGRSPDPNVESSISGRRQALINQQSVFQERLDQLQVDASLRTGGVQLVSPAEALSTPVSPKPMRNAILGLGLGLVMGLAFAFLVDYFDDTIKTKDEFERVAGGLLVLGEIPLIPSWKNRQETQIVSLADPTSPAAEAYRSLRTSINFLSLDRPLQILQITSPTAGDGKTATATNLAVALAMAGQRVVIVDCDLRRPRLHEFFQFNNGQGFTSVLLGEVPLAQALLQTPVERLSILVSGPVPPNPSELLSSGRAREVFAALRAQADVVIIDSPPVLPVTDPTVLASAVDATLLVSAAHQTTRHGVHRAVETLRQVSAPLIGAVLNGVSTQRQYGGYGTYGQQYYTGEEERRGRKGGNGGAATPTRGRRARANARG